MSVFVLLFEVIFSGYVYILLWNFYEPIYSTKNIRQTDISLNGKPCIEQEDETVVVC